ncbi:MAG: hypothetical protein M3203_05875, partial [Actinomycetota bacterium]|nr:hypothetical protein [Actinomycetota bacterium]
MRTRRALGTATAVAVLLAGGTSPARADVESANLPGGTSITAGMATPAEGALVAASPGDVDVTGTASVGQGQAVVNTALIYVVDASGSTQQGGGCGGNQNNDSFSNTILDCEIAAAKALNQQAAGTGTVGEVGLVVFGNTAVPADVGPAVGQQSITGPGTDVNGTGGPDVEEVLSSILIGGVTRFTSRSVGSGTNFEAAVQAACGLAQQTTMANVVVAFLSDGAAGTGGYALDDVPCGPKPATFQTFAVGTGASCLNTGGGRGSLAQIAAATGGTCTQVTNLATLPDVLPGVIGAELARLTLTVDGGSPVDISADATPSLPQPGPVSVNYAVTVPGLGAGVHELCVTAHGTDGGGVGSVTDCHSVTVAGISLSPANETRTTGPTHTVTATVAAGSDGGVAGVPVTFEIVSGPNAGTTSSATTGANGQAPFTYSAAQGPGGLGTDVIEACFTDDQGTTACATATKTWDDTTPPVLACSAGPNPSGNQPPAGGSFAGFYTLTATDDLDPQVTLTLTDPVSGAVFGPFPSGTQVKLTRAPGATPSQSPGAGANEWHITVQGQPVLT